MEGVEAARADAAAPDADAGGEECAVCVCVHVRPLIEQEALEGCQECLRVTPGQPQARHASYNNWCTLATSELAWISGCPAQVCTGPHTFTFDHVYGGGGASPDLLYEQCIQPLVAGLFSGFNATCLAYGQARLNAAERKAQAGAC